ncbi:DNA-directed RNA polymerase, mitochondrial, partial [Zancudomyces culisetae]
WLASEDPWQTLAACIELVDAVDSGDPENFVSHLHVHQDGTCNGLQHYAALGRDFEGGRQVNLVPGDHPMDVYSAVLDVVEVSVRRDAANGHEMAQLLVGKLKRKVIKQTVMTNVYGVSMYGAREQVMARLKEIVDPQTGAPLFTDRGQLLKLATYLAHRVFESLGEIFECARQIQDWLNEAASRIARSLPPESVKLRKELARLRAKQLRLAHSTIKTKTKAKAKTESTDETNTKSVDQANTNTKSTDETETETKTKAKSTTRPDLSDIDSSKVKTSLQQRKKHLIDQISSQPLASVTWTTPLNLIIVQPYRKLVTKAISSSLQYVSLVNEDLPSPVNSQKQKTAFPPNFVHSLDASHMLLSAIQCKVNGIVFSSVHDSYWTHACDIDMMNNILREQFVALHQKNILTELRDEFMLRYKDYLIPVNTTKVSQNNTSNLTSKSKHDYSLDYDHNADKIKLTSKISYIPFDLPPLPPTGTLDINSVLDSKYFFS